MHHDGNSVAWSLHLSYSRSNIVLLQGQTAWFLWITSDVVVDVFFFQQMVQ